MKPKRTLVATIVALNLVACGAGGGSEGGGICRPIASSGSSVVDQALLGASIQNPRSVFDGSLGTSATLTPPVSTIGRASLTGTLSSGQAGGGGVVAGVAMSGIGATQTAQVTITTYRQGILVETLLAGIQNGTSQVCPGTCLIKDGAIFFGIATLSEFDSIKAEIDIAGSSEAVEIKELCVL